MGSKIGAQGADARRAGVPRPAVGVDAEPDARRRAAGRPSGCPVLVKAVGRRRRPGHADRRGSSGDLAEAAVGRRGARRRPRSVTARCSSSDTWPIPATSRSRSSATRTASVVHLVRARVLDPAPSPEDHRGVPLARRVDRRAARGCARRRSPRPGPSATSAPAPSSSSLDRDDGRLLLPGGQHPAAGRAPGHRAGHRTRPRRAAAPRRRRQPAAGRGASGPPRPAATRSRPGSTPRTRRPTCCRRPARLHRFEIPAGVGAGSAGRGLGCRPGGGGGGERCWGRLRRFKTPTGPGSWRGRRTRPSGPGGPAVRVDSGGRGGLARSAPTTTRCWPRSSPTPPPAPRLLPRWPARWPTPAVHGVTTNRDLLVRTLRHPAFGAGDIDTGFLDRHGLEALSAPLADAQAVRRHAVAAALAGRAMRRSQARVQPDHAPGLAEQSLAGAAGRLRAPAPRSPDPSPSATGSIGAEHPVDLVEVDGEAQPVVVGSLAPDSVALDRRRHHPPLPGGPGCARLRSSTARTARRSSSSRSGSPSRAASSRRAPPWPPCPARGPGQCGGR